MDPLKDLENYLEDLISTSMGRRAFLASVPALLAACSTSQHRGREGDNSGQMAALTVAEEKRLTQEALPEMRKQYPPVRDPNLQKYINRLGQRVVNGSNLNNNPYRYTFTVVDVNYVNAFALPAGTVMVTAPLIAMAGSEAELAGVIGHEIGHIKARHTAERMYVAKKEQSKSWLYGLGGGILGGAAGFGLGQLLCAKNDRECQQNAAVLGAAAGAGGGLLIQKFAFMANSREDEMEADRIGFRTAVAAGYSKDHVGRFYAKLLKMEQRAKKNRVPILSSVADAMSTHPPSQERVDQMSQMARQQRKNPRAVVSSKSFRWAQSRSKRYGRKKS